MATKFIVYAFTQNQIFFAAPPPRCAERLCLSGTETLFRATPELLLQITSTAGSNINKTGIAHLTP